MATKEAAMTVALSNHVSSFCLVRRADGWHCGSIGFYQAQNPGTQFALDQALEWELYEDGQLVATSHDTQAPAPKIGGREPLWWERESAERHAQLVKLVELRNEVRDLIRFGEL